MHSTRETFALDRFRFVGVHRHWNHSFSLTVLAAYVHWPFINILFFPFRIIENHRMNRQQTAKQKMADYRPNIHPSGIRQPSVCSSVNSQSHKSSVAISGPVSCVRFSCHMDRTTVTIRSRLRVYVLADWRTANVRALSFLWTSVGNGRVWRRTVAAFSFGVWVRISVTVYLCWQCLESEEKNLPNAIAAAAIAATNTAAAVEVGRTYTHTRHVCTIPLRCLLCLARERTLCISMVADDC